jgi:adenosylcobinamide-phosphate synthase
VLFAEPLAVLGAVLVAVALDLRFGEPSWLWSRLPHPVVAIGGLIGWLECRLANPAAAAWAQRCAGVALWLGTVGVAVAVGWCLALLCAALPFGWVLEGCLMASLIAWRSLHDHVAAVATALARGVGPGRAAVAQIVGRDPDALDAEGVARAAIESLAENLSDGVVAPLLFALTLGLPGLLAYKAANTLDSMVGHRTERYRQLGWTSARIDDLLNLAPARLSALLIALSAGLRGRPAMAEAWRAMWGCAAQHRSPNAGWPEAAMAGALGLRLAGPRRYGGALVADAWMGYGSAAAGPADIRRALRVAGHAYGILVAALLGLGAALMLR